MYNNIKYWIACISFLIACFSFVAQAQQNESNGKITPEEKARYEKQFSGANYRVNDDGTIEFLPDTTKTEEPDLNFLNTKEEVKDSVRSIDNITLDANQQNTVDEVSTVQVNNNAGITVIKKERKDPVLPPRQNTTKEKEEMLPSNSEKNLVDVTDSLAAENAQDTVAKNDNTTEKKASGTEKKPVKYKSLEDSYEALQALIGKTTNGTETENEQDTVAKNDSTTAKKIPVKYKSLEDSYEALQALRKKIANESSSDLPNRIKNEPHVIPQSKENEDINFIGENNVPDDEDLYEKFGDQPSYFINGVLVNKEDAEKISSRNIVSKEIKTRNTTTGNPNGEIWITTR